MDAFSIYGVINEGQYWKGGGAGVGRGWGGQGGVFFMPASVKARFM